MTISTAAGGKLFIGSSNVVDVPEEWTPEEKLLLIAEFEADSYVEVGEIEDMGEFGDTSTDVTFVSLSDARTRHLKGSRDAGTQTVVVGDDMTDEGQIAMEAAERTPFNYNFKIQLNDARSLGGTDSVHYYVGMVGSKRRNVGNANNVVRRNFAILINSAIVDQDPT